MHEADIISVIVLAYNSADTITSTLESIAKQEYGAKNIELIISDDASQINNIYHRKLVS
ncbi:glycosyltransferase [Escherichia coli]|uniref:glycosyltransferase n=1 Tax=Escherichia coli TaxID=562 RepID=UPI003EE83D22